MSKKRFQVKLHDEGHKDEWYARGVEIEDTGNTQRLGGLEIVVLYDEVEEKAEAMRFAERIAKLLNEHPRRK